MKSKGQETFAEEKAQAEGIFDGNRSLSNDSKGNKEICAVIESFDQMLSLDKNGKKDNAVALGRSSRSSNGNIYIEIVKERKDKRTNSLGSPRRLQKPSMRILKDSPEEKSRGSPLLGTHSILKSPLRNVETMDRVGTSALGSPARNYLKKTHTQVDSSGAVFGSLLKSPPRRNHDAGTNIRKSKLQKDEGKDVQKMVCSDNRDISFEKTSCLESSDLNEGDEENPFIQNECGEASVGLSAKNEDSAEYNFSLLITSSPKKNIEAMVVEKDIKESTDKTKTLFDSLECDENKDLANVHANSITGKSLDMCERTIFSPSFPHTVSEGGSIGIRHRDLKEDILEEQDSCKDDEIYDLDDMELHEAVLFIGTLPCKSSKEAFTYSVFKTISVIPNKTENVPKITLVLDLDETLVHCSIEGLCPCDTKFTLDIPGRDGDPLVVYVRWRPHLFDFLRQVKDRYEIILFTASHRIYAETLCKIMDPDSTVFKHRLFRDSCKWVKGNFIKDLDVLNRNLATTIIVDNSPQAFSYHVQNGYPIKSWYGDKDDRALLSLARFLEKDIENAEDVRNVIRSRFQLYDRLVKFQSVSNVRNLRNGLDNDNFSYNPVK